nr:MAG TPA: hypothetical protein [Caudoviricetes sp.]
MGVCVMDHLSIWVAFFCLATLLVFTDPPRRR